MMNECKIESKLSKVILKKDVLFARDFVLASCVG